MRRARRMQQRDRACERGVAVATVSCQGFARRRCTVAAQHRHARARPRCSSACPPARSHRRGSVAGRRSSATVRPAAAGGLRRRRAHRDDRAASRRRSSPAPAWRTALALVRSSASKRGGVGRRPVERRAPRTAAGGSRVSPSASIRAAVAALPGSGRSTASARLMRANSRRIARRRAIEQIAASARPHGLADRRPSPAARDDGAAILGEQFRAQRQRLAGDRSPAPRPANGNRAQRRQQRALGQHAGGRVAHDRSRRASARARRRRRASRCPPRPAPARAA